MEAKFFLQMNILSRAKGATATRAAAYRAGERIHDKRTSKVHDYSDREDVVYKEIVLPAEWDGRAEVDWARDRETLWNAAEFAGKRCDARVAREVMLFLPPELTPAQRVDLVRKYARTLAENYRGVVDAAIHTPRPGSDERHNHAHLLMTAREVTPEGLGRRTTIELGREARAARGLGGHMRDEYVWVRKRWAEAANEALREAGIEARIDHRSLRAQGINREPTLPIPQKIYYAERKSGMRTLAGDELRARYHERVEARLKGGDELARVLMKHTEEDRRRAMEYAQRKAGSPKKTSWAAMTREERNARARQWDHANREKVNRQARERYRKNAATISARRRERRKVDGDEIRRRDREQYHREVARKKKVRALEARAVEGRAVEGRVVEQRAQSGKAPAGSAMVPAAGWAEARKPQERSASGEDAVANWKAFRASQPPRESAEDSAAKWKAFRASQPGRESAQDSVARWKEFRALQGSEKTPQESVSKWREFRERELRGRDIPRDPQERVRGQGSAEKVEDDDDEGQRRKKSRSRDYDLEL